MLHARRSVVALRHAAYATNAAAALAVHRPALPNVVLIDAVRTPFATSGTIYRDMMAVDLQRQALKGLVARSY